MFFGNNPSKGAIPIHEHFHPNLQATLWEIEVIFGAAYLEKHQQSIATIHSETTRNRKITELTGLFAETGLFPGIEEAHILTALTSRISEVYTAYQMAKNQDQTLLYFQEAFIGPPCFNGRFITLETFMQNILCKQPNFVFAHHLAIDDRAIPLEEILHQCKADQKLTNESVPSIIAVTEYIHRNPGLMKEWEIYLNTPDFDFLDRIAAFIPPPRRHRHHYHGVFAPNAPQRRLIAASASQTQSLVLPDV